MFQYWKYIIGITLEQTFSLEHRSASSVWSWQLCVSLWFVFCLTWAALVRLSLTGTVINLATLNFTKNCPLKCSNFLRYFRCVFHTIFCLDRIAGFCVISHLKSEKEKPRNNMKCRDCFVKLQLSNLDFEKIFF